MMVPGQPVLMVKNLVVMMVAHPHVARAGEVLQELTELDWSLTNFLFKVEVVFVMMIPSQLVLMGLPL